MEAIEIKLDEANELFFTVQVEGSATGTVDIRLICESDDFSAVFPGSYSNEGEVCVIIPEMSKNASFKENKNYSAKLEVMVDNRRFIPLAFDIRFKETLRVFAEVSIKTAPLVETKKLEKKQEPVVEAKKHTHHDVTAKIINNPRVAAFKETASKRQEEIFKRLNMQK